jgi:hypothetical protein
VKKFILLFLVLFILVFPLSVFASDISLPSDMPADYYLVYYNTYRYVLVCSHIPYRKSGSELILDGQQTYYYTVSADGKSWESIGFNGSLFRDVTFTNDTISLNSSYGPVTVVYSNYDIIDSDTGDVFFSLPSPPSLMEIVATQVQEIPEILVIVAVLCLTLLVSLMVLPRLPRILLTCLRRFFKV